MFIPKPLYDNDFGTPSALADKIKEMKSAFQNAGVGDIPVSISDMAYGWQSAGDISSVADVVDFFMINNFPYFAWDAQDGGSETSWNDFMNDISYFEGIAGGKPLLVTQVRLFSIIVIILLGAKGVTDENLGYNEDGVAEQP